MDDTKKDLNVKNIIYIYGFYKYIIPNARVSNAVKITSIYTPN